MWAALGVQARVGDPQPLDRPPANQMLVDNFRCVFRSHMAIPHRIGIDHDGRTVLALIEAARLVDAHSCGESRGLRELLQLRVQFAFSVAGARWTRRVFWTHVMANKDMMLE